MSVKQASIKLQYLKQAMLKTVLTGELVLLLLLSFFSLLLILMSL